MCAPIAGALIGAVASVAGSMMQASAQQAAIDEQNRLQQQAMERSRKLRQEEVARQNAARQKNEDTLEQTTDRYEGENQQDQLEQIQKERIETATKPIDSIMSPTAAALPQTTSGSTVVNDDLSKRLASAAQKSRDKLSAYAKLGGYDQNFQQNALMDQTANRNINLVNNVRQGSLVATNAGVGLINSHVGKADPPDLAAGQAVAGLGGLFGKAVGGGIFG